MRKTKNQRIFNHLIGGINESIEDCNKIQEEISKLDEEYIELQKQLQELQTQIENIKDSITSKTQNKTDLQREYDDCVSKIQEIIQKKKENCNNCKTLRETKLQIETKLKDDIAEADRQYNETIETLKQTSETKINSLEIDRLDWVDCDEDGNPIESTRTIEPINVSNNYNDDDQVEGTMNSSMDSSIEDNLNVLTNLETVLFVSSDKACSPINNYGMAKALSETFLVEKSHYIKNINKVFSKK